MQFSKTAIKANHDLSSNDSSWQPLENAQQLSITPKFKGHVVSQKQIQNSKTRKGGKKCATRGQEQLSTKSPNIVNRENV